MNDTVMEQYWVWLSSVEGIGPRRFYQLLTRYGDARTVWDALGTPGGREDMRFIGDSALEKLRAARNEAYFGALFGAIDACGARVVTRLSDDYPPALAAIYDPPPTLFARGGADLSAERMIAVVGSRRCTRDGQRAAREIAGGLAREGVTVVSGMARGVDTCAHEGALAAGGITIAVLGCGVDVIYPPENDRLMARILESGGAVISEYAPGTQPLSRNFPPRNRVISGLCSGTLVVEGARGSGALITVSDALEQGRDVFAVPGSIYSPLSETPNRLIVDGAIPTLSPWEILEHYRWAARPEVSPAKPDKAADLDPGERALVEALREQPLSFDELAALSGLPAAKLSTLLTLLELRGIVASLPGGQYRAYL